MLEGHAQIYMPKRRKEIHFFDWYYKRGIGWYERFFPAGQAGYRAVGEVTPDYLYEEPCPARIRDTIPYVKLIVILRNPADRAYSHYRLVSRDGICSQAFEEVAYGEATAIGREIIDRGFYSRFVERYLRLFDRNRFLFLVFEKVVKDLEATKSLLASFLDVDTRLFPENAGREKINPVRMPKARKAYAFAKRSAERLRRLDIDWLVNFAKGLNIGRLFGVAREPATLGEDIRSHLTELYRRDIERLESMLQLDLSDWYSGG